MFDLDNEGQSDGARHTQWCLSIGNIKIYKRRYTMLAFTISEIIAYQILYQILTSIKVIARICTLALIIFEILMFQMFNLQNVGQGQGYNMNGIIKVYKRHNLHLYSHRF